MRRGRRLFRLISTTVAILMFVPAVAPVAEAAVFTLLSPRDGDTVSGRNVEIAVGYNTESNAKVTKLELWIDGYLLATKSLVQPVSRGVASFWWDVSKASPGVHNIVVKVYAGSQLIGSARGRASVGSGLYDLRSPAARIANVKAGQVLSGKVTLRIVSSDDGPQAPMVSLMVDNALKLLSNTQPCVYDLDTTQYSDGEHELQLVAYDSLGNKSQSSVVKVQFKNGLERPVAVAPEAWQPKTVPASEDDYTPRIPSIQTASKPNTSASAARELPEKVASLHAAPAARPIAKPKTSRPLVGLRSTPKPMDSPMPMPSPIVVAKAPDSTPSSVVAPVVESKPQALIKADPQPLSPLNDAMKHEPVPTVAATQIQPPVAPAVAPEPPVPHVPVKTAMLMSSEISKSVFEPMLELPAPVRKDTKAKLEKRTLPSSGKVKLRDLFDSIGGVVFWDAASKTVFAYGPGVEMELQIGSPVVKVNGKAVQCSSVPVLVNGRTVIDAGLYRQALELAAPSLSVSAVF